MGSKMALEVKNLSIGFKSNDTVINVVNKISFEIKKGETLAIVGESGCGKSITALSILKLIPSPPGVIDGEIIFNDKDLLKNSNREMRNIRGKKISMIFQEPSTSLNPVIKVGEQLIEVIRQHQKISRKEAEALAIEMIEMVGISLPEKRMGEYPHYLSGGMQQRIMIAMALVCKPELLIADEPTTALDVTIQAQVLKLIADMKKTMGSSVLLITHDLGVVAETCDRAIVMYCGRIMEEAPVSLLLQSPLHPYTMGLIKTIPRRGIKGRLYVIPGKVPNPSDFPTGCVFYPRCSYALDKCKAEDPPIINIGENHSVRCWLRYDEQALEVQAK